MVTVMNCNIKWLFNIFQGWLAQPMCFSAHELRPARPASEVRWLRLHRFPHAFLPLAQQRADYEGF